MKRLSPKWINRLIVGLLLLAPILFFAISVFATLAGNHGSFDLLTDGIWLIGDSNTSFLSVNWLTTLGNSIATDSANVFGFRPVAVFVQYIDDNLLHFATNNAYWGLFMYGYVYWCFHVILIDLACYAVLFVPRLIFRVLNKLEGDY